MTNLISKYSFDTIMVFVFLRIEESDVYIYAPEK